ncbi:hypothetical protein IGI69_001121 [Enterococcus sp. DIV1083b]|uniref:lipopolysaccharide biosynthesis protein n=1 Tax=Enterococcus TaxID=1350 RepID=UPI003D6C255D
MNNYSKAVFYFIGNFGSKFLSSLLVPIYAIYLTSQDLGEYDFQLSIAQFLAPILLCAIWESVLKFSLSGKDYDEDEVITTSVLFSTLLLIIEIIVIVSIYVQLYSYRYVLLYSLLIVLTPLLILFQYIVRSIKKNRVYVEAGVLLTFFNFLLILITVVLLSYGLIGLLISQIISQIICIIYMYYKGEISKKIDIKKFNLYLLKKMLLYSTPLIFNLVFIWFSNSFSRFFININMGSSENGMFAFSNKFVNIVGSFGSIITMVLIEDALVSVNDKNFINRFEKNVLSVFKLMLIIGIVSLPVINIFYSFITSSDFFQSFILVPYGMLSIILTTMSSNVGNIFNSLGKTKYIFYSSIIGGTVNVIFILLLGDFLGLVGVSIGSLIGSVSLLISRYFFGNRLIGFKVIDMEIILIFVLFIITSLIFITSNVIVNISVLTFTMIFCLIKYKNNLKEIKNKLLK